MVLSLQGVWAPTDHYSIILANNFEGQCLLPRNSPSLVSPSFSLIGRHRDGKCDFFLPWSELFFEDGKDDEYHETGQFVSLN
ncbi:hypothetical protein EUGRSUZ_F01512 [Eucalyptus grandis]|uniref:Uncharacterized protein n=2 Tax=Eucalyptus grandis TaxID=71139 RepID=A0ACC3KE35_EUCGR|nr:hypothetical protein EUGRSUZ_F01512 [Eucalyptus grandis]